MITIRLKIMKRLLDWNDNFKGQPQNISESICNNIAQELNFCWLDSHDKLLSKRSIIEGDQNQVAVFSLEHFSNLTRSAWDYQNARNQSAKAGRLIKNEPQWFS